MKKRVVIFIIFLNTFMWAQYERPGSTSGQFLKIGVSPRASAMANAFVSMDSRAEAAYYNPAALVNVDNLSIAFNHTSWFAGINYDFFSTAYNSGRLGVLAFSVSGLYTDEMKVRTPLRPEGTGETFYAGNLRLGLSYAKAMTDYVSFGATVNYININLGQNFSADAVSIDIAALYQMEWRSFNFGMMISNFGSNLKFVNEAYPLPATFTFGLNFNALEFEDNKLLISIAAEKPNDGKPSGRSGIEWNYNNLLFLRAGYRFNHDSENYSGGLGINLERVKLPIKFDYSYTNSELLGGTHRVGLQLNMD